MDQTRVYEEQAMMLRSLEETVSTRGPARRPGGAVDPDRFIQFDNFFGLHNQVQEGVQGFHVTMPVDGVGPAHFHDVDQFQVFFGVPGARYGRDTVPDLLVHYADAFTPYGPFSCGATALKFYTLRAQCTVRTLYMPNDRKLIPPGGKRRNLYATPDLGIPPHGKSSITALFNPQTDGAMAWLVAAGADAVFRTPQPEGGMGQYCCVVKGAVELVNRTFPEKSLGWMDATDPPVEIRAATWGCAMVVMQFPKRND
jgi:hypothetical protein